MTELDDVRAELALARTALAEAEEQRTAARDGRSAARGAQDQAASDRDKALAGLAAARDDREHARGTVLALWAEAEVLRAALSGDEITLRRAAEAGARPAPDPWAQVTQLRAGLREAIEAAEQFGGAGAVSVLWRLVHRHDPEHEHFGDNGVCFECGASTDAAAAPAAGR